MRRAIAKSWLAQGVRLSWPYVLAAGVVIVGGWTGFIAWIVYDTVRVLLTH